MVEDLPTKNEPMRIITMQRFIVFEKQHSAYYTGIKLRWDDWGQSGARVAPLILRSTNIG